MALIFQNCNLIDGVSPVARPNADVIVEQGRIAAVENHISRSASEHRLVPAGGSTLMPGLIDCHSHYTIDAYHPDPFNLAMRESEAMAMMRATRAAREALESGVTTTRDAGAPRQLNFPLRDAIAAGLIPGPRILSPGYAITITGGHGWKFGREADGLVEFQKAVREQVRDGADVIKIIASEAAMLTTPVAGVEELTQEEIEVMVKEARRLSRRIFSHAQNSTSLIRSARAGVDSVEHAFLANHEALRTLKECGTALIPTLTVTEATLELPDLSPEYRAREEAIRESHWASCEEAIRLGVNVLPGTDTGVPGVLSKYMWREIRLLHERGLSKMDALRAATSRAATLLGIDNQVGSIQPGKQADLILFKGDPLADITCLRTVDIVVKAGKIAHIRQELQS